MDDPPLDPGRVLMWSNYRLIQDVPIATVRYDHGPWFYLQVSYSYLLITGGFVVLTSVLLRYDTFYTNQAAALALAVLIPWLGNVLWILDAGPVPGLDLTQYAFGVTASYSRTRSSGSISCWSCRRRGRSARRPSSR